MHHPRDLCFPRCSSSPQRYYAHNSLSCGHNVRTNWCPDVHPANNGEFEVFSNLGGFKELTFLIQIVVGVTKAVGERFGKGGIADRMIWFNGFPFLDNKEEHTFGVPVSSVMTSEVTSLPSSGLNLRALEGIMSQNKYQGFPVIENRNTKALIGYIGRTELRYAIDRAKKDGFVSPNANCFFTQPESTALQTPTTAAPPVTFDAIESVSGQQSVDFSRFIDPTPLAVHPRLPLETVMELFKKMGPQVILVDYRGRLAGLVTVKDCLKFQFKVEAHETTRDDSVLDERQEKLWDVISRAADWVADKVMSVSGGRVKLGGSGRSPGLLQSETLDPRDHLEPIRASRHAILDGTEDEDTGVELQDR